MTRPNAKPRSRIADLPASNPQSAIQNPHFPLAHAVQSADVSAALQAGSGESRLHGISVSLLSVAHIARWELATFFRRPVSYILLLGSVLLAAWAFAWLIALLARGGLALRQTDDPIAQYLGPNVFLISACTLLAPLLTMNLVADERRRSTWEVLLTAPVSAGQVLAGKFIASWGLLCLCLTPWLVFPLVLRWWNGGTRWLGNVLPWFEAGGVPFDFGPLVAAATGLVVLAGTFVALGLFCSAVCRRPMSAALLSMLVMGLCLILGLLPRLLEHWQFGPRWIELSWLVSCWGQMEWFSRGTILPRVIVGHISLWIVLWCVASAISRRVDDV